MNGCLILGVGGEQNFTTQGSIFQFIALFESLAKSPVVIDLGDIYTASTIRGGRGGCADQDGSGQKLHGRLVNGIVICEERSPAYMWSVKSENPIRPCPALSKIIAYSESPGTIERVIAGVMSIPCEGCTYLHRHCFAISE